MTNAKEKKKLRCSISVRNALIVFALFSMLGGIAVFATSLMLITALRKEYERKMVPWLYGFAAFTAFRLFAFVFFSTVNDMIFAYNIVMCLLWTVFLCFSIYGWLIVYSLYVELCDLTRLEDLAHLRVSFLSNTWKSIILSSLSCSSLFFLLFYLL